MFNNVLIVMAGFAVSLTFGAIEFQMISEVTGLHWLPKLGLVLNILTTAGIMLICPKKWT